MKKLSLALLLVALLLSGCGTEKETEQQYTFTDDLGNQVSVQNPKSVSALLGSFADTWLLAGGELACVTQDAFDERNLDLPKEIANAGSTKTPSPETILASGADFVLLSANIEGHVALGNTLKKAGISCAYFDVETFEDYLRMLKICTAITNREDLYQKNGLDIKQHIETIKQSIPKNQSPRILLIRAYGSGAKAKNSADNMCGAMLKDMGCLNIADSDTSLLSDLSMEQIIKADPDYIFVTTMGDTDKALATMSHTIQNNPAWNKLTAVTQNRYHVLEKELFHYKPNSKWGESYEKLAQLLYRT